MLVVSGLAALVGRDSRRLLRTTDATAPLRTRGWRSSRSILVLHGAGLGQGSRGRILRYPDAPLVGYHTRVRAPDLSCWLTTAKVTSTGQAGVRGEPAYTDSHTVEPHVGGAAAGVGGDDDGFERQLLHGVSTPVCLMPARSSTLFPSFSSRRIVRWKEWGMTGVPWRSLPPPSVPRCRRSPASRENGRKRKRGMKLRRKGYLDRRLVTLCGTRPRHVP